ncbi:cation diffusion facilitator family transporter [Geobacillus sp. C56-T2]|uniref:cation diffusion facilitator family transporter n=1 Tax=Geobacillus sp. C56-T2 TaxID=600773 RepID=UPI0011A69C6D|nr:cation diffusion facilitator family transporter [Geobacillus sp. C56-T2]NNV07363.1 cation transporter [Geobacillus sp. MMMUD3]TWG31647.1 cobalt-zinc-cadmium efflux system protein [Geobacillus sp. C56-T2]
MASASYDFHHLPHVKTQSESKKALWVTLALTILFTAVEIAGGILSNSLALLSDSAHMASDVLALGLSMIALYLATRPPNPRFTFGFLRFEIITSFLNGLTLAVIALWILWEGIQRFLHPQPIQFRLMLGIAAIGLVVNATLTIVLSRSTKAEDNLNVQSALWHFIGDLISSIGVIVSALLIYWTGWTVFDPIISLVIAAIIFTGGAKIMRESYLILMEAVPERFDLEQIRADIRTIEGVEDVHDMHLWAISTDHYSLSAHVFVNEHIQPLCVILAVNELLKKKYGIEHATIQVEHAMLHDHGRYGRTFLEKKKILQ